MYIENLQTPHPRTLHPGQAANPFVDAVSFEQIKQRLAAAPESELEAAGAVASIISHGRRALRYPTDEMMPTSKGETTFETLAEEQITSCLGYTAVLSECLSEIGMPHYIGYANTHWMVLRPSTDKQRLHMADMLSPVFNQDITDMLRRGDPESIASDIARQKRSAAMITTLGFQSGAQMTMDELDQQYPWVTVAKQMSPDNHQYADDSQRHKNDHTCIISAYEPETGMSVMHEYAYFRSAMAKSNLGDAAQRLHSMKGLYPEVDARAPHNEIRRLIKGLCATQDFELALQTAEDYASSFTVSEDPRLKELEGDMYRYIGKASRDPESARLSYQAYEAAAVRCKSGCSQKVMGKIAASSVLVSELDA